MKNLIISILLACLPISTFAATTLTCPSINDINEAIAHFPDKVITPDDILPFAGFNEPFGYSGTRPLKQVTAFDSVFIPVTKDTKTPLRCVYKGINKDDVHVTAYFLNVDMGPYHGIVGTWEPVGRSSNCISISSDVKNCQFARNDS